MKWKNSLNIIQFVQMTDTAILDRISKRNTPVFDIMSRASKMGVYSAFDWPSINKQFNRTVKETDWKLKSDLKILLNCVTL